MPHSPTGPLAPQPLLRPVAQRLLLLVVGVLLALPTVDHVWGIDRTPPPEENRVLASSPPMGAANPRCCAFWRARKKRPPALSRECAA